eukprot:Gb_12554 [translate_table: standard]
MSMAQQATNEKKMVSFLGVMIRGRNSTASAPKKEVMGNHSSPENVITLCKQGRLKEALNILHVIQELTPTSTYASLLQGCVYTKSLPEGKLIHAHIIRTGFKCQDILLGNALITMYAKCGSLVEARSVLDQMAERNVVSWTLMIAAYSRHGCAKEALTMFSQMQLAGIQPNQFTFAGVLPACANLESLKDVHEEIIRSGFESDLYVGSALVDMYAKHGSIESARHVFDKMPKRDVVLWNMMIVGYAQNGFIAEAMTLFQKMPKRSVVSWTVMITAYCRHGFAEEALTLFNQMLRAGIQPNQFTFTGLLPACTDLVSLKDVHEEIIRSGLEFDVFVGSALVDMYAKCGSVEKARHVFDKMPKRNVVSWNVMIAGYAQNGHVYEAMELFQKMPEQNVVSWNVMIAGFAQNGNVEEALNLFHKMPERNVVSWNAMMAGYVQNGYVNEALKIFKEMPERNVISWNAMITGFAQNGHIEEALKLFKKMPEGNVVSWNAMIAGYAQNGQVDEALELFQKMPEQNMVSWTSMLAGYAKNGHIEDALKLFQKMPKRDVVSWTTMISGYSENGHEEEALKLFQQMQLEGMKPDLQTFSTVLPSCANLAALKQGKEIHEVIIRSGFQSNVIIGSALVNMYAKCGSIETAHNVFENMPQRDVVSWSVMILGYGMHGCVKEALQLFEQMQHCGLNPDHVTFIGVLSACCHAGLVDKGWQYFDRMCQYYHITPAMEHYGCMVDLLGRAGCLDDAHDFINKMPVKPNAAIWGSLLGACRIHNNIELAERSAEHLFELDPKNAAPYVLLSNIYAVAGRWDDIEKVRKMMKVRGVKKQPGCSWIEVNKQVHTFLAGDRSHPQIQKIHAKLERLSMQMKEAGYAPDTRFVR